MKRILYPPFVLLLAVLACSIPSTPAPPQAPTVTETALTESTVVAETPAPTEPPVATETPAPTEEPLALATCYELSILLNPDLASGYNCERVPESTDMIEIYPEYTRLTLQGYPLSDSYFEPAISVYSVQRYNELRPDVVPQKLSRLQELIAGGSAPVFSGHFDEGLPFLPIFNAGQVFFAAYQVVPFVNGSGIRYLTEYAQFYAPVSNNAIFYTYQGLSSDGQFWISAILPVRHPMLPANGDNPPNGMSWDEFGDNYQMYIRDMVNQLNAQPADSYFPALTALDALLSRITIQP